MAKKDLENRIIKLHGKWAGGMRGTDLFLQSEFDRGSFSMEIIRHPNGYFEGTSQDKHGEARITGEFVGKDMLCFEKEYISSSENMINEPINHVAKLVVPGHYTGSWAPKSYGHLNLHNGFSFVLGKSGLLVAVTPILNHDIPPNSIEKGHLYSNR